MFRPIYRPIYRAIATALTQSRPGGFEPSTLFSAGEQGYVYDLNDLSTLYLDSAGTTPASVNGLVGLVLDKSKGLALGAELVPTGDMSDISAWTVGGAGTTIAVVGGELEVTGGGGSFPSGKTPGFTTVVGDWYTVSATARRGTTASSVSIGSGAYSSALNATTSNQTLTFVFQAVGTTSFVACLINSGAGTGTAYFDNITVKRLAGNHAYQSTTGNKPVLRGSPIGANLVTNGTFDTDLTGWSLLNATGTVVSGEAEINITGSNGGISQNITTVNTGVYRVRFKARKGTYTGTQISTVPSNGFPSLVFTIDATTRTFEFYFTATSTLVAFRLIRATADTGTVYFDDIEILDVSAGSVKAPYALQFDGVDDFLQTASVNFTATDKMTVCHGVRKLSDAAVGVLVELGATAPFSTNNAFGMYAPVTAAANYGLITRGTSPSQSTTTSAYPATTTNVVTGLSSIATDVSIVRVNGVQDASNTADQGTGNYSNLALYFGRRGGASLPYNGLMYSAICVGKAVSATELANIERWTNQRTLAY